MKTFYLKSNIGIGDAIQFTSLPENYYFTTGEKLIETSQHWVFDHNPYVIRGGAKSFDGDTIDLWDRYLQADKSSFMHGNRYDSNAEIISAVFNVKTYLKRPNLYYVPKRKVVPHGIIFHPDGISQRSMPTHVAEHFGSQPRIVSQFCRQVGLQPSLALSQFCAVVTHTPKIWDLVSEIASCQQFIGIDSGPSWIASCFPYIWVKKILSNPKEFIDKKPLTGSDHITWFWDESLADFYNTTNIDIGFTKSYLQL